MLAPFAHLDPRGMLTPQALAASCRAGQCGVIEDESGHRAAMVTTRANGVLWVQALAGDGPGGFIDTAHNVAEAICEEEGLHTIALQTARPGLRRALQARGFEVAGWIMRKRVKPCA